MKKSDRRKLNELDRKIDILTTSLIKLTADMSHLNNTVSNIKNTVDGQFKRIEDSLTINMTQIDIKMKLDIIESNVNFLGTKIDGLNSIIVAAHQTILSSINRWNLYR